MVCYDYIKDTSRIEKLGKTKKIYLKQDIQFLLLMMNCIKKDQEAIMLVMLNFL